MNRGYKQFDASRRGKKQLAPSRDRNERAYHSGEGKDEPCLVCDLGSELRQARRYIILRDEQTETKQKRTVGTKVSSLYDAVAWLLDGREGT